MCNGQDNLGVVAAVGKATLELRDAKQHGLIAIGQVDFSWIVIRTLTGWDNAFCCKNA